MKQTWYRLLNHQNGRYFLACLVEEADVFVVFAHCYGSEVRLSVCSKGSLEYRSSSSRGSGDVAVLLSAWKKCRDIKLPQWEKLFLTYGVF